MTTQKITPAAATVAPVIPIPDGIPALRYAVVRGSRGRATQYFAALPLGMIGKTGQTVALVSQAGAVRFALLDGLHDTSANGSRWAFRAHPTLNTAETRALNVAAKKSAEASYYASAAGVATMQRIEARRAAAVAAPATVVAAPAAVDVAALVAALVAAGMAPADIGKAVLAATQAPVAAPATVAAPVAAPAAPAAPVAAVVAPAAVVAAPVAAATCAVCGKFPATGPNGAHDACGRCQQLDTGTAATRAARLAARSNSTRG